MDAVIGKDNGSAALWIQDGDWKEVTASERRGWVTGHRQRCECGVAPDPELIDLAGIILGIGRGVLAAEQEEAGSGRMIHDWSHELGSVRADGDNIAPVRSGVVE